MSSTTPNDPGREQRGEHGPPYPPRAYGPAGGYGPAAGGGYGGYQEPARRAGNGLGITSLILGILGLLTFWLLVGGLLGLRRSRLS